MRIVHVVTALNPGGLERVVVDLATHQAHAGHIVRVICLDSPGALANELRREAVTVCRLTPGRAHLPVRLAALARQLRQFRADLVHSHNPGPHMHAVLAARLAGVQAVVHTKHGRNYPDERLRVVINHVASRLSAAVVAVSDDAAAVAREVERIPRRRLHVIRNGVDLDAFQAVGDPAAASRAVHVARLHPVKDQVTLLHAVARVVAACPGFALDIVGDGPERERLERLAAALAIERHVRFRGYQRNVRTYLNGAAFFVLSSVSEGLSMTIIEAMAAGLPVIATRVGGNPEAVDDGRTGLLVPSGDPGALAAAMTALLGDPAARQRMGRAARARVESHFSLQRTVADYDSIYRMALGSPRRGAIRASKATHPIHP